MLTASYLSVKAVKRDPKAKAAYIQHFGDGNLVHLNNVTNIIRLMHDRVGGDTEVIMMSYVPNLAAFNALGVGPLPAGTNIEDVEAFVVQVGVDPGTALSVYVCPAFFTGNVYIPNAVNRRTGTGTILHELSHGVGGTADHAYTWQGNYAGLNAVQRSRNADTYRAYCQSFDNPLRK
jgi:hypothetical protein